MLRKYRYMQKVFAYFITLHGFVYLWVGADVVNIFDTATHTAFFYKTFSTF